MSSPTAIGLFQAGSGDRYRPRLRALIPLPAQVVRTAGFYFMPASPAKCDFIAYYQAGATLPSGQPNPQADDGQDAKTQEVTLTIAEGDVTLPRQLRRWTFEAALDKPCTLNVDGGSAPYTVSDDGLPPIAKAVVNVQRKANPRNAISHDKFVVLLKDGVLRAVWTGSTNWTEGAIYGQLNVGHAFYDAQVVSA